MEKPVISGSSKVTGIAKAQTGLRNMLMHLNAQSSTLIPREYFL